MILHQPVKSFQLCIRTMLIVCMFYAVPCLASFQLGWYGGFDPNDIEAQANHGCSSLTVKHTDSTLWDVVDSYGMKGNIWIPVYSLLQQDWDRIAQIVNFTKYQPCLLTWQLADEPEAGSPPNVPLATFMQGYYTIKQNDPNHPVNAVFNGWNLAQYPLYVDQLQTDEYPVEYQHTAPCPVMNKVVLKTNWHVQQSIAAGKTLPVVFVAQSFSSVDSSNPQPNDLRWPTYQECRYMSFAPMTVGATGGVLYYTYQWNAAYKFTQQDVNDHRNNVTWPILSQLKLVKPTIDAAETTNVSVNASNYAYQGNSLVSGTQYNPNCPSVSNVTCLMRKYTDPNYVNYVLVAVNNLPNALSGVVFTFSNLNSGTSYTYETLFNTSGNGYWTTTDFPSHSWSGNQLIVTKTFNPWDVLVLRIREHRSAYCGDSSHAFPNGDLNNDCQVNMKDFAIFAQKWLIQY